MSEKSPRVRLDTGAQSVKEPPNRQNTSLSKLRLPKKAPPVGAMSLSLGVIATHPEQSEGCVAIRNPI